MSHSVPTPAKRRRLPAYDASRNLAVYAARTRPKTDSNLADFEAAVAKCLEDEKHGPARHGKGGDGTRFGSSIETSPDGTTAPDEDRDVVLLLGDSFFERLIWKEGLMSGVITSACEFGLDATSALVANAGCGGDTVENVLYRLPQILRGLSSLCQQPRLVLVFVGTNNRLDVHLPDEISDGVFASRLREARC